LISDAYNDQNRRENESLLLLSSASSGFHLTINQPETLLPSLSESSSKILIIGGGFHLDKTMTVNQNAGSFSPILISFFIRRFIVRERSVCL
jgi:hypothetical protein